MFTDYLDTLSWEDTSVRIAAKTAADVEQALRRAACTHEDFLALLSPAAAPYLETMARLSRQYTEQRFGRTVEMFLPVYLSNACANGCRYCGFHADNPMPRTVLTEDDFRQELQAIRRLGPFDSLLLLTGEHPAKAGPAYIARMMDLAAPSFSDLKIEVMPLEEDDYRRLRGHGLTGAVCFQETYHRPTYARCHPYGRKAKFDWRANVYDRMARAGLRSIGMGALVGLAANWRTELAMLGAHLQYMRRHYWQTRYSINLPRLRPSENGGYEPACTMSDREFAQAVFAFRIYDHDVGISLSTRERPALRDALASLGVTIMSAGSRTEPGGYSSHAALEQFAVDDSRTPAEVCEALRRAGREPLWYNSDASFERSLRTSPATAPARG